MTTTGTDVSSVSPSGLLVPVLPARSVARAVMLWAPSFAKAISVAQTPPFAVVVPIWLPPSNRVIVALAGRSLGSLTVPAMGWFGWLFTPTGVVITAGGAGLTWREANGATAEPLMWSAGAT